MREINVLDCFGDCSKEVYAIYSFRSAHYLEWSFWAVETHFAISQFDESNKELNLTRNKTFEINDNIDIGLDSLSTEQSFNPPTGGSSPGGGGGIFQDTK